MDVATILILVLAVLAALSLWRLAKAIRNCWDGNLEDLLEDVVIRRLAIFGVTVILLVATLALRGRVESLLGLTPN